MDDYPAAPGRIVAAAEALSPLSLSGAFSYRGTGCCAKSAERWSRNSLDRSENEANDCYHDHDHTDDIEDIMHCLFLIEFPTLQALGEVTTIGN